MFLLMSESQISMVLKVNVRSESNINSLASYNIHTFWYPKCKNKEVGQICGKFVGFFAVLM